VVWVAPQSEIAKFEQDKEDARIALDNRVDLVTEYIQINYHNAAQIYKALTEAKGIGGSGGGNSQNESGFLSGRGRLVADERTNTLMISDIPKKVEAMKELIRVIDRPVDQVLIEARVVIASETFARELGARFGVSGFTRDGNLAFNNTIENNVATQNSLADAANRNSANPPPNPLVMPTIRRGVMSNLGVQNPAGSVALSILNAGYALDVELSALQEEGRGEVISNPRIVTSNQREAVIRQGQEVGYVTITPSQGGGSIPIPNVQFKDVLLELKVTPTITSDGRVFLNMAVKKDEVIDFVDTSIGDVPLINKREVNTAVLVEDGQTVVVGGVYEFRDRSDLSKVPFLGDIPFLGICRGMQVLNTTLGGTLIQHLPDVIGSTRYNAGGGVFTPNPAITVPGTRVGALLGDRVTVQSYHHQALDAVADGLIVSAVGDDGIIQAVDVEGLTFGVAVQWHPEETAADDPRLFTALIDAAVEYRDHRKGRA